MATNHHLLLLVHLILMLSVIAIQTLAAYGCIEVEREALLTFKAGISDGIRHSLSSWDEGQDCCRWRGVVCDNTTTRNILELNLRNPYQDSDNWTDYALSGEINPSLLALNHLTRLDLSNNNFSGISIPEFIASFNNLTYLNLSNSEFGGKIPHQLGNLSKLRSLDLSWSYFIGIVPPQLGNLSRLRYLSLNWAFNDTSTPNTDNLEWISQLASLKYLDMGKINITNAVNWLHIVNKLQSIRVLLMSSSSLPSIPNHLSYVNFMGLTTLDLSNNWQFNTTLSSWLWNLTNLSYLNLEYCLFRGKIPDALGNLTSLIYLNLGDNNLEGPLPRSIGQLCNLRSIDLSYLGIGGDIRELVGMLGCKWNDMEEIILSVKHLDLRNNSLVGSVPHGIGNLQNLNFLDLSSNSLRGVISEAHFANLTKLNDFLLSSNSLIISVGHNWIPPFQLTTLALGSCQVGSQFPAWLRWQRQINEVDVRNTSITGTLPHWLWSLPLKLLDLSYNNITGRLPVYLKSTNIVSLDLKFNNLEGLLPPLPDGLKLLDLSNNFLCGPLPKLLPTSILYLLLSNNLINGSIPSSICELASPEALDLSGNNLSGELPQCWQQGSGLEIINFSNNNITGEIPPSVGSLTSLLSLDLSNNNFYGELPSELQYCKNLVLLDLGNNKFSGDIPIWIGENLLNLRYLQLRSNMFDGNIPPQLAQLTALQVLDLSYNKLLGSIPRSFGNFTGMISSSVRNEKHNGIYLPGYDVDIFTYKDKLFLVMQGKESTYSEILYLVRTMDLSRNNLSGVIPEEIGALRQLNNLNLSRNHLIGRIPEKIFDISSLEYLDLSSNELSGAIPQSISKLTFLDHLNLSYNNLSGRIPSGSQLDTLNDPSIYIGNAYLCGPPTSKNCSEDSAAPNSMSNYANGSETSIWWSYLGMGVGFVVGFWGVYAVLLFHTTWRCVYFRMIDNFFDNIYITVAVSMNRLKNRRLPAYLKSTNIILLDLKFNNLEGPLPPLTGGLIFLDLSSNSISGPLPEFLPTSRLYYLSLSNNLISGSIPSSICELANDMWALDLSRNNLSGEFPQCWQHCSGLKIMDFSNNNITGEIPPSVGSLTSLQILDLSNNNFYGELSSELQHCKNLFLLDLSNNNFSGKIPIWIGEKLPNLKYLQLRSNMFDGNIPPQLAQLAALQVLDLSYNKLSGSIPCSFGNFTGMMISSVWKDNKDFTGMDGIKFIYRDSLFLVMQGKESKYSEILYLVKTIDLSRNNLSGVIPEEIGALWQLENLNLAGNHLVGIIPEKMGNMLSLESLDLSSNKLSGAIPQSISKLTFLDHLNLSYNNLSGRIPSGSQLDKLDDPSIYIGNAYLCGPPTSKNCPGDTAAHNRTSNYANGSETSMWWLYLGMGVGFVVGFWGVYAVLLFHGTWMNAYFRMIDDFFDNVYVTVAVSMNRLINKYG
ncbi:receptor-like protein EIX2 [Typha angustifolia]|uniref:receptor-like protein EIX2 n=1 Tax=Typha angustifolia TaxID=59011 RepID=UPI003C2BB1C2